MINTAPLVDARIHSSAEGFFFPHWQTAASGLPIPVSSSRPDHFPHADKMVPGFFCVTKKSSMKTCITCGETKPLTDYYVDRDGYKMRCKPCHREWRWKGRKPGEPVPRCKLTPEDVILIRELLADAKYHREQARKLTLKSIAEKFEVSKQTICEIGQLRTWVDV